MNKNQIGTNAGIVWNILAEFNLQMQQNSD